MDSMTKSIECSQKEYAAYLKFVARHHRIPFEGEDIFAATRDLSKEEKINFKRITGIMQESDKVSPPLPSPRSPEKPNRLPISRLPPPIPDAPKKIVRPPAVYSNKSKDQYIDEILAKNE